MLDPDLLVDQIADALQNNPDLVPVYFGSTAVIPYHLDSPNLQNVAKAIFELNPPSLLIRHVGTRTGRFGNREAIRHDFGIAICAAGKVGPVFVAIREGKPSTFGGYKFKDGQLNDEVYPIEDLTIAYRTLPVTFDSIVDYPELTFTVTERGVDI